MSLSEPASFDDILAALATLEGRINGIGPGDGQTLDRNKTHVARHRHISELGASHHQALGITLRPPDAAADDPGGADARRAKADESHG